MTNCLKGLYHIVSDLYEKWSRQIFQAGDSTCSTPDCECESVVSHKTDLLAGKRLLSDTKIWLKIKT
jgi:hypothetical protein